MARLSRVFTNLLKPDVLGFFFHTRSLSQWMVAALRKQGMVIIDTAHNEGIFVEYRGCKFRLDPISCQPIFDVYREYRFDRIRPDDVVLDIGAQIGAFAIPAAKIARRVYAVEPLFHCELLESLRLNRAAKVYPLLYGVRHDGEGCNTEVVDYWGLRRFCRVLSFPDILREIQGSHVAPFESRNIDVLKIDCEGCEWYINPEDLKGIRVIEAELHTFGLGIKGRRKMKQWISWLEENGYNYELEHIDSTRSMLHAEKRE